MLCHAAVFRHAALITAKCSMACFLTILCFLEQTKLSKRRKISFIVGTAFLSSAVVTLIVISFIFSYSPDLIMRTGGHNHG